MKSLKLIYFARLRERLEQEGERVDVDDSITNVASLMLWLSRRGETWKQEFKAGSTVRAAVNLQMAQPTTLLSHNDEIAFFPPVTGG